MTDDDGADLIRDFRDLPNDQSRTGERDDNGDRAWNERRVREEAAKKATVGR